MGGTSKGVLRAEKLLCSGLQPLAMRVCVWAGDNVSFSVVGKRFTSLLLLLFQMMNCCRLQSAPIYHMINVLYYLIFAITNVISRSQPIQDIFALGSHVTKSGSVPIRMKSRLASSVLPLLLLKRPPVLPFFSQTISSLHDLRW